MTETFHETPVADPHHSTELHHVGKWSTGHILVGLGLFVLFAQLIPGTILLPALIIAAGQYDLRRQRATEVGYNAEGTINRGHILTGIGGFLLLVQIVPGSMLLPLLLIGTGIYFLQRSRQ